MNNDPIDDTTMKAARSAVHECDPVRKAEVERAKQRLADHDLPDDEELAVVMICQCRLEAAQS